MDDRDVPQPGDLVSYPFDTWHQFGVVVEAIRPSVLCAGYSCSVDDGTQVCRMGGCVVLIRRFDVLIRRSARVLVDANKRARDAASRGE